MLEYPVLSGRWRVEALASTPGWRLAIEVTGSLSAASISGFVELVPGTEIGLAEGDEIVIAVGGDYSGPGSAGGFGPLSPTSEYKWVPDVGLTVRIFLNDDQLSDLGLSALEVLFIQDDDDNPAMRPTLDLTIPESLLS